MRFRERRSSVNRRSVVTGREVNESRLRNATVPSSRYSNAQSKVCDFNEDFFPPHVEDLTPPAQIDLQIAVSQHSEKWRANNREEIADINKRIAMGETNPLEDYDYVGIFG